MIGRRPRRLFLAGYLRRGSTHAGGVGAGRCAAERFSAPAAGPREMVPLSSVSIPYHPSRLPPTQAPVTQDRSAWAGPVTRTPFPKRPCPVTRFPSPASRPAALCAAAGLRGPGRVPVTGSSLYPSSVSPVHPLPTSEKLRFPSSSLCSTLFILPFCPSPSDLGAPGPLPPPGPRLWLRGPERDTTAALGRWGAGRPAGRGLCAESLGWSVNPRTLL